METRYSTYKTLTHSEQPAKPKAGIHGKSASLIWISKVFATIITALNIF